VHVDFINDEFVFTTTRREGAPEVAAIGAGVASASSAEAAAATAPTD
jgi:ATP-dependent Clp protease ATP-binding subunit ClpC